MKYEACVHLHPISFENNIFCHGRQLFSQRQSLFVRKHTHTHTYKHVHSRTDWQTAQPELSFQSTFTVW